MLDIVYIYLNKYCNIILKPGGSDRRRLESEIISLQLSQGELTKFREETNVSIYLYVRCNLHGFFRELNLLDFFLFVNCFKPDWCIIK